MNARPLTEAQLAAALQAHLPANAPVDLRERIAEATATTSQQRLLPSFLGTLSDADPIARRRSLLIAAAALLVLALAGAAAAGALRLLQGPDPFRTDVVPGSRGLLAEIRDGDLYLAGPDGTGEVLAAHVDGSPLSSPRWSADGRWIAVQTGEPAVILVDARTLTPRRLATGTMGAWAPAGGSVALVTPSREIAIVQAETGEVRQHIPWAVGSEGFVGRLEWSPDGRWLAANAFPLGTVRIDLASGGVLAVSSSASTGMQWSPDSRRVALVDYNSRSSEASGPLVVADADGTNQVEAAPAVDDAFDLAWSPDGAWIAYVTATTGYRQGALALVRPDGRERRMMVETVVVGIVGWTPDGTAIAYVSDDDPHRLLEVAIDTGITREVPVARAAEFAWAVVPPSAPVPVVPSRPPGSGGVPGPDESPMTAPSAPTADPKGSGLALFGQAPPTASGDGPCGNVVLTFTGGVQPDEERPGPVETAQAVATSPLVTPAPMSSCGGVGWAPDGSAYLQAAFGLTGTFDVYGRDGRHWSGPTSIGGEGPVWSPDGAWIAANRCLDTACARGYFIVRPDGSAVRELPGRAAWSADGEVIAVGAPDGTLLVGRADGSDLKAIGAFPSPAGWAPDGSHFAFVRDGDVWVAARDGTGSRNVTSFELGGATAAAWSPDGRWIAVRRGQALWVVTPDGSQERHIGSGFTDPLALMVWSPDGSWLAIGDVEDVILYQRDAWHPVLVANATLPAWSPDGRYLAVATTRPDLSSVDVMNADGSGRRTVWPGSVIGGPVVWVR